MESCSSFFLPRMVGYGNATYLLSTGRRFPAESKLLDGIFAEVVPEPRDVMPKALEVAQDILSNVSTMAAHLNRQLIWRNGDSAEQAHLVDSPLLFDQFGGKYVQSSSSIACRKLNHTDRVFLVTIMNSRRPSSGSASLSLPMSSIRTHHGHIPGGQSSLYWAALEH